LRFAIRLLRCMAQCREATMDETEYVERLAEEYRRLHLAMGALHLGLEVGVGSFDYDDSDWCEIELEKLYLHLDALGATWRVNEIEVANNAILHRRKKLHA
jgi:hypothetical protein